MNYKYQGLQLLLIYNICVSRLKELSKITLEHLPEQYQVCLSALSAVLKHAYKIMQPSPDNIEKLQAMELFKDTMT